MTDFLEKTFRLKEHQTDVRTEILAGITTFMTMAYILAVNPGILSAAGMDAGAVFTATALVLVLVLCSWRCSLTILLLLLRVWA